MEANAQLPSELAALVHQVELNDPGWRTEMIEKVITLAASTFDGTTSKDAIRDYARVEYDVVIRMEEIERAVEKLEEKGKIRTTENGLIKISEKTKLELEKRLNGVGELEEAARNYFEQILKREGIYKKDKDIWIEFKERCLIPTLKELGARTFRIISYNEDKYLDKDIYRNFIDIFEDAPKADKAVKDFFRSDDEKVKSFVLRNLHAYLLTYANDLGEEEISGIRDRANVNTELNIFVDTNFLFSVFKIHKNPANPAVDQLMRVLFELGEEIRVNFYVHPLTLKEFKSTLRYYKDKLSNIDVSGNLEESARLAEEDLSGISSMYIEEASRNKKISTPDDFLSPYIEDPLSIARENRIEVYREDVEYLKEREGVVDDISEIHRRSVTKSIDAAEHDALLWHFVKGKRGGYAQNPLDAGYWFATVDGSLIDWDDSKTLRNGNGLSVCLSPTDLLQMLQVWVPRSEEMKDAMFNGVVSLLPDHFDPQAEDVTIDILETISKFEGHERIPTGAMTKMLVNKAIRSEIEDAEKEKEKEKIIENSFNEEIRVKQREVDRLRREVEEMSDEMEKEKREKRGEIDKLESQIKEMKEGFESEKKSLKEELKKKESKIREKEESKVDVEEELEEKKSNVWWLEAALLSIIGILSTSGLTYISYQIYNLLKSDEKLGVYISLLVVSFASLWALVEILYMCVGYTSEIKRERLVKYLVGAKKSSRKVAGLILASLIATALITYFL